MALISLARASGYPMANYLDRSGLKVDSILAGFIEDEALPPTGIAPQKFWDGVAAMAARFMPRNRQLLAFRDQLQGKIDAWHREHGPVRNDPEGYERFLKEKVTRLKCIQSVETNFAMSTIKKRIGLPPL